ncbi:MAG: hypothetical protein ACI4MF_03815 [Candidatus Faecivicinus sp.]
MKQLSLQSWAMAHAQIHGGADCGLKYDDDFERAVMEDMILRILGQP